MENKDELLYPHTVAKRLKISRSQIYRLMESGEISYIRVSPRTIRIRASAVQEFIKKNARQ